MDKLFSLIKFNVVLSLYKNVLEVFKIVELELNEIRFIVKIIYLYVIYDEIIYYFN